MECENAHTALVPSKIKENTLRFTRSEEDLGQCRSAEQSAEPSLRPEPSWYSIGIAEFDGADCWSQDDDDIIQVKKFLTNCNKLLCLSVFIDDTYILYE